MTPAQKIEKIIAMLREYLPEATAQDLAAMAEYLYTGLKKAEQAEEDALWFDALIPADEQTPADWAATDEYIRTSLGGAA
jgi:uncharacterized protein (DUF2236 family)